MVRSLLARERILKTFWPKAVNWSVHILNICLTFAVLNMTSEEAWSGRKPSVEHFRIFGCIGYAHAQTRNKRSLMIKGKNVYSWVLVTHPKLTDCSFPWQGK